MGAKPRRDNVCVIIPAYNESSVIGLVIEELVDALRAQEYTSTILVVNDASTDQTADVALRAGATVITHILNSGAGGATATGLSFAEQNGFTIAATMDADGQHSAQDVVVGIATLRERQCDLLIGSRLIDTTGMSAVKVIGNKGLSMITYLLFGIRVTDSQSGMRVFSRRALEVLRWKTMGYEFCSEMLWRAQQKRLKVEEYSIAAIYTEYSVGKGQNNWNALNIVRSLVARRITELLG